MMKIDTRSRRVVSLELVRSRAFVFDETRSLVRTLTLDQQVATSP